MRHLPTNPRILITRLSAIGDCIHTLPLVSALREKFPSAYIAWATQSAGSKVLQGLDGLDEVIVVERDWIKSFGGIQSMRERLRQHKFDVTIDPQSLTKSSWLAWLANARLRIGFAKGQGRELGPWLSTIRIEPKANHVVDRYLELLRPLGIENAEVRFNVPHRDKAAETMRAFVSTNRIDQFALLNPGAGWNSKLWPHQRYADVAKALQSHRTRSVVLWAGEQERAWAEDIVENSDGAAILAPDTSLAELAELCRIAKLFVGSDTGPMHMAAAVGTPCVAMYGPTKISVCGPYGVGHEPLQVRYQGGSSKERRGNDNSAMSEISVDLVVAACARALGRNPISQVA